MESRSFEGRVRDASGRLHSLRSRLGLRTRLQRITRRGRPLWSEPLEERAERYFGNDASLMERERKLGSLIRALTQDEDGRTAPDVLIPPLAGRVTSPFGERMGRTHNGVDIAAPNGRAIRAAASGRVLFAGDLGEYGHTTIIGHGGRLVTLYGHQRSLTSQAGDVVQAGDIIGRVGTSGRSTGPHLHFEVRRDGTPQDPALFETCADRDTIPEATQDG
jgi:murein DD-endopeptidase MepM/ murein hydrolase activator NlpD